MARLGRRRAQGAITVAFRFKLDDSPQTGLRRIATEQATKITTYLKSETDSAIALHDTRKALKRLRSLFKLVREALPKQTYAQEYGEVRAIGQALSGQRDLDVLPVVFASLVTSTDTLDASAIDQVRSAITHAQSNAAQTGAAAIAVTDALDAIEAANERYAELRLHGCSFEILAIGAGNGLRALRGQHEIAVTSGQDEDYHDWRKSAQLHWRQLRLVREAWPAFIDARIELTKALAKSLGSDHDLSVLAKFVSDLPGNRLRATQREAVLSTIRSRQLELRASARALARPLVVDKPKTLVRNLRAYAIARADLIEFDPTELDPFIRAKVGKLPP